MSGPLWLGASHSHPRSRGVHWCAGLPCKQTLIGSKPIRSTKVLRFDHWTNRKEMRRNQ